MAALFAAAPVSAQALTLQASRAETGWIKLSVPDAGDASHVTLVEQVGAAQQPIADVAPTGGTAEVRHAAAWRCDRFERRFAATAGFPDGSTQTATAAIRTPSCAKRYSLVVRRLRGGRIRTQVRDRWKLGAISPRVCVRPPARRSACHAVKIGAGRKSGRRDFRARSGGLWVIALGHVHRTVYIRPRGKLRLLATGDSMIQVVDTYLKERLGKRGIGVRSDARISTGLSKPFLTNWPRLAAKQARGVHPDVTVVFIGANDGFPFGGVDCCGDAWVDAYAKRAEAMMRSYSRGGRSLVYWLTLPAPRPAQWRPIYPAVNRAIKRAAARTGGAARVLDIARTFTPGYRFRQSMTWRGRRENVRQADGVHLSASGASIAETLIQRALGKDGVL
jgi:lysophospholipase L1-like esterase